jgi:hypothetical protein
MYQGDIMKLYVVERVNGEMSKEVCVMKFTNENEAYNKIAELSNHAFKSGYNVLLSKPEALVVYKTMSNGSHVWRRMVLK